MSKQGRGQSQCRVTTWYFLGKHRLDDLMKSAQANGVIAQWDDCRGSGIWFDAPAGHKVRTLIKKIEDAGLKRVSLNGWLRYVSSK